MDLYGSRRLTVREREITSLVAQGMKNPEIATALDTTDNVIKNHLRKIMDKTGTNTRLELALWKLGHENRKPKRRVRT